MKKRFGFKVLIYFLCVSFLVLMSGFPRMVAEAKEKDLPIGEMVSNGEVKFEAGQNIWKGVESSHFPIFQGTRIRVEKGIAFIALSNNSQIKACPNSLFSFDQVDRFILSQGGIEFRISSTSEINFKVGNLSILKSRTLQALRDPSAFLPNGEEAIGSISIRANGSVTVKSIQGKLTLMDQDRVVLAALSSNDSVTIRSITVEGKPLVMVAKVPLEKITSTTGTDCLLEGDDRKGVSTTSVIGGLAGVAAAGGIAAAGGSGSGTSKATAPLCP